MRIGVAQTRPVKGDIRRNIAGHKALIKLAADQSADSIIFPELSLTGYEPQLAKKLAMTTDNLLLEEFRTLSETMNLTIGVGVPMRNSRGITISMLLFKPHLGIAVYSKKYLHPDEEPFFVPGDAGKLLDGNKAAIAICYELSVPQHAVDAFNNGAEIYIASVAKSVMGIKSAVPILTGIARQYDMTVLMSNCVGPCEGFDAGGQSSAWNREGVLLGQLNDSSEGILIVDTVTKKAIVVEWIQSSR